MPSGIESLLIDTSRAVADQVCGIAIKKPEVINELMELSILVHHCFEWLNDADETVAIRVYSMNILANICKFYPELIPELKQTIELHYDDGSAGFKSRATKILKNFN